AQTIHFDRETRLSGYVGESAIFVVVIERGVRPCAFLPRPARRVDQQNILPAIVVVIDKGTTRTSGFRKILLAERTVVMFELNARLCVYVGESNRARVSGRFGRCRGLSWRSGFLGRLVLLCFG